MERVTRVEEVSSRSISPRDEGRDTVLYDEATIRIIASTSNILVTKFYERRNGVLSWVGEPFSKIRKEQPRWTEGVLNTKYEVSKTRHATAFSRAQTTRRQSKECIEDQRLTSRVLGTRGENTRYEVQGARHGRRMYKERGCG